LVFDTKEDEMRKGVKLKDESEVFIREMHADDLDRSLTFFRSLSDGDRAYLRRDVTDRVVVRERIERVNSGRVFRLVAVVDD
jgi:hypothetical protein